MDEEKNEKKEAVNYRDPLDDIEYICSELLGG